VTSEQHSDVKPLNSHGGLIMAGRTGGELIQDFLATYEIPYVFGNPGTTETTFLAAVAASKATNTNSRSE
jgi:benzoylformate decarboxylase